MCALEKDDLLGLVSIPVAMVPTELKRLRFKLDQVERLGLRHLESRS